MTNKPWYKKWWGILFIFFLLNILSSKTNQPQSFIVLLVIIIGVWVLINWVKAERSELRAENSATNLSPVDFESYCVHLLNKNGWLATTTKASGDQGIDIVATRGGKKAVFQCKKYSSPVGNKAVQEAIAGKAYASADYSFVVSNAAFTRAAKDLAGKAGVHLIHYSSLSDLSRYLKF